MIVSAAKWYAFAHMARHLILWLTLLLYAKYLPPDEYGLLIILNVVNGVILLLKDFGLGAALIHSDQDDDFFYSSLYWLNLLISFVCFIVLFFSSDLISILFKNNILSEPIKVISVSFLFLGISGLKVSSFEKKFNFKIVAAIELVSVVTASALGIFFAIQGLHLWAYVIQVVTYSMLFMLLLLMFSERRLSCRFNFSEINIARKFSRNLIGYSVFNYMMKNLDTIIIGSFLGEIALGIYSLAFRLVVYPIQTVSVIAQRVLFPIFARISDDIKFNNLYIKFTLFLVVSLFPIYGVVFLLAPDLVPIFFGAEWIPSVQLLYLLIPVGLMQVFVAPVGIIYQAKGRTDLLFKWGLISSISTLAVMMLSIKWGVTGIAIGFLVITIILFIPALMIPFSLMHYRVIDLLRHVRSPIVVVLLSFFISLFVRYFFMKDISFTSMISLSFFFLFTYVFLMWFFEKKMINEILASTGVFKR